MVDDSTDIYRRINSLEQEIHTLKFRAETLDSHNLPIRVANLEPSVMRISSDVARMESGMEEMKDIVTGGVAGLQQEVSSMKSWGKGVAITLSAVVVFINLLPAIGRFLS